MFLPSKDPSAAMYFVYALSGIVFLYAIYRGLFTKLKTPQDYVDRAKSYVSFFRYHKKAIRILEQGLALPNLEKRDEQELHFRLGIQFFRLRDFSKATKHFDHVLPRLKNKKLEFDKGYLDMIMSYYNDQQEVTARKIYHQLLSKQHVDPRFGIVTTLDSRIFKDARNK
ncbi:MAG: hypothetical protein GX260_03715 [Tissierellia bacterium]|nr:hypothetical protein [Bacillota bacterium]NLL22870.1 hypothetical protein [Tissierellia bacterium]